jgi:hypothetical protein
MIIIRISGYYYIFTVQGLSTVITILINEVDYRLAERPSTEITFNISVSRQSLIILAPVFVHSYTQGKEHLPAQELSSMVKEGIKNSRSQQQVKLLVQYCRTQHVYLERKGIDAT